MLPLRNPRSAVILTLSEAKRKDLHLFFTSQPNPMLWLRAGMHEGSYCTYIMASRSRTLYIGVTGNLHQRVFGFTARYNCDRLV